MLVTLKIQCYVVRFLGDLNFTVSEATSNSEFSLLAMKISLLAENFPVAMQTQLQGRAQPRPPVRVHALGERRPRPLARPTSVHHPCLLAAPHLNHTPAIRCDPARSCRSRRRGNLIHLDLRSLYHEVLARVGGYVYSTRNRCCLVCQPPRRIL